MIEQQLELLHSFIAVALPGGVSIACVDNNGATDVVVRADDVSLTRSYDASGQLVEIRLAPCYQGRVRKWTSSDRFNISVV